MRYTSTTSRSRGFTLIEVLIIAPIVVLAISGFVALMITMVGNILQAREQNALVYETQDALDRIEQDARLTTQFLTTSGGQPSPQGSNNGATGTAAFTATAGGAIILSSLATTKNPADTTRELVYYTNQPYACSAQKTYNKVFLIKIIYFINAGSLWRRTIVPPYNTTTPVNADTVCDAPWQRNTCSPGMSGGVCQTNDSEVMKNISSLNIDYYSSPSSDTSIGAGNATAASSIAVNIQGLRTVAGRTATSNGTMRATKLNLPTN